MPQNIIDTQKVGLAEAPGDSTDAPKTGPLRLGEIAVEDIATGETVKGAEAMRRLCRQIPAYRPLLPLLQLPFVARYIDKQLSSCDGDACHVA